MDLKCILTFCCLSVARFILAQNFNVGVVNPDLIYYNEGGQRIPSDSVLQADAKRANWPNQDNWQNPEQRWPNVDASYLQGNRGNVNNLMQAQAVVPNRDPNFLQANRGNVNPGLTQSAVSPNRDPAYLQAAQGNINPGQQQVGQSLLAVDRFGNSILNQNAHLNNNLNQVQRTSTISPDYYGQSSTNAGNNFRPAVRNITTPVDPLSLALGDFSLRFMKSVPEQQGNLVVSPFSVATLLALLQQGSLGATQQQITNALQLTPSQAADGFRRVIDSLNKRYSSNILKVANNLFIADGFEINPAYKKVARNDFGSDVTGIKFNRPAVAAQKVNAWVASKTNNKIDKLISPDTVSADTQLVLVNAVYFKGLWAVKFKPEATMLKDFYLSSGGKKTSHFMRMRRNFRTDYDKSTSSQVLVLPFENEVYSLVLILPSVASTVTSVLAGLKKEHLIAYQYLAVKEVAIELPKFTVKTETNLASVLVNLGITNIFGPASELSGIGSYRQFAPQVSSALHSALLSIDEEGGTAAAATSFAAVALSYDDPSVVFNANRPFLAILWDNTASIPLFMARIEDPVS